MAEKQNRFSRRTAALFWCLATGIIIGALIYWEQIALLYVLATLLLVALLVVVGRADLQGVSRENAGFSVEQDKI